jgi:hypothetical protein
VNAPCGPLLGETSLYGYDKASGDGILVAEVSNGGGRRRSSARTSSACGRDGEGRHRPRPRPIAPRVPTGSRTLLTPRASSRRREGPAGRPDAQRVLARWVLAGGPALERGDRGTGPRRLARHASPSPSDRVRVGAIGFSTSPSWRGCGPGTSRRASSTRARGPGRPHASRRREQRPGSPARRRAARGFAGILLFAALVGLAVLLLARQGCRRTVLVLVIPALGLLTGISATASFRGSTRGAVRTLTFLDQRSHAVVHASRTSTPASLPTRCASRPTRSSRSRGLVGPTPRSARAGQQPPIELVAPRGRGRAVPSRTAIGSGRSRTPAPAPPVRRAGAGYEVAEPAFGVAAEAGAVLPARRMAPGSGTRRPVSRADGGPGGRAGDRRSSGRTEAWSRLRTRRIEDLWTHLPACALQ